MRIGLILWVATLALSAAAAPATKLNVLLFCVDDLKPSLRCYGDTLAHSPNIDRLASRGMRFERAYCNQAVCAPSRNALMTGMRPTSLGIYDLGTNFRLSTPDAVTLTQYFMQHGYRAEGLGKILHVGHGNKEDPKSWSVPHWPARVVAYAAPRTNSAELTREEALFSNTPADKVRRLPRGPAYENLNVADDQYPDGKLADEAIRRLRAAKTKPDQPFFLAVGFVKPHLPFCAPRKYWDLYDRNGFSLAARQTPPEGAPKYAPQFGGELRQYDGIPDSGPIPEDTQRAVIHGYYAAISYMDAQLGRVLDELDRLELAKNTVIVLWGDHGWHLGDHGIWCKHTNYEQANRIPMIVAAPGITKPGAKTTALVETVDLYPTLCEMAGLPAPKNLQPLDGESFVRVLKSPSRQTKDAVFHAYPRRPRDKGELIGRAIRTERYRLVEWKSPGAAADTADLELYDYEKDPGELRNLAKDEPRIVAQLRKRLEAIGEAKPQVRKSRPE